MPETTTQTLFTPGKDTSLPAGSVADFSQSEKDAILRQIHPIFLTTHTEDKTPVVESNFDKFLGFMRLCLEGALKLVDILVDAAIQVARLGVWIVAISGVLIVVTLMTNTTDKFIDLLNESVFKAFGISTRIEKVQPTTATTTTATTNTPSSEVPTTNSDTTTQPDLQSNTLGDTTTGSTTSNTDTEVTQAAAAARARRRVQSLDTTTSPTTPTTKATSIQ